MHNIIRKCWHEFAVNNVFDQIKNDDNLKMYLSFDDMIKNHYSDSVLFWGIAFTVNPDRATIFYLEVIRIRESNPKKLDYLKVIEISQNWKKKLILDNFIIKCK
jgi:hypothetical protein